MPFLRLQGFILTKSTLMTATVKLSSSGSSPGFARSAAFARRRFPHCFQRVPLVPFIALQSLASRRTSRLVSKRPPPLCFCLTVGSSGHVRPVSILRLTVPLVDFTSVSGVYSRHRAASIPLGIAGCLTLPFLFNHHSRILAAY